MDAAAVSEKKRAAMMSLLAALFLTALKVAVGVSTGSLGVLAEAAHSALDLVAAGITFFAIRIATRPADRHHAYGHGKAENLAALAETLLLLLTCGWIVNEAIDRLFFSHSPVKVSVWAFAVMILSMLVDFNRARMLSRVAKKHRSQALEADALHFSTDIFSSAVVIFGLFAVWAASFAPEGGLAHTLLMRADSAAALIVAVIVAWVSLRLGARAVDTLLDAGDREDFAAIEAAATGVPGVIRLKELRIRRSGASVFADMRLILPADSSLEYSHALTEQVEQAVRAVLPAADLTVHYEPDDSADTVGRIRRLGADHGLDLHAVEIYNSQTRKYVTLHAALDPETPLTEAHAKAEAFEAALRAQGYEALTHLEPRRGDEQNKPAAEINLPDEDRARIRAVIDAAMALEPSAGSYHDLTLLAVDGERRLSFHCCLPGRMNVEQAHDAITRIEKYLHKNLPDFGQISIHTDIF